MATIQGIYVALFGRPADPIGLAYFNEATNNGADLSAIGDLASTEEYQDRFDGMSNAQIIRTIYQSLFNRDPEDAGLEFFTAALNNGTLNINNIAIAILDGAQGDDKTIVTNKITAADKFTAALDTDIEIASYSGNDAAALGRAVLTPVGKATNTIPTDAQIAAAVEAVVNAGTGGETFVLKGVAETVTGTGGNDVFDGTLADSWQTGDKIDGGFGVDTLKAVLTGNLTPAAGELVNVEKLVLDAHTNPVVVDLVNVKGVQSIVRDSALDATADDALTVNSIALGTSVGLAGTIGAATTFAFADSAGSSDSATLTLAKANSAGQAVTIGAIESLAIQVSGNSNVDTLAIADTKTITVTGSGNLELAGTLTALKTFDASGLDGALTLNLATATTGVKVTGTNGVDTITLAAAGAKDTIVYNTEDASTYTTLEKITNFITTEDKIDLSAFGLNESITELDNLIDGASFGTGNSVLWYADAGTSWVFVDSDGDGSLDLTSDFAIQLTGTAAVAIGDFIFSA